MRRKIDKLGIARKKFAAARIETLASYEESCRSEIEKLFLIGLYNSEVVWWDDSRESDTDTASGLEVCGAKPAWSRPEDGSGGTFVGVGPYGEMLRKIAIELDGHDFHERTKEQARKDKSRDRLLVADGWTVVRFTGPEVWADAEECARDVEALAWQAASKWSGRKTSG